MRRHDDLIEVTCDADDAPGRFVWRGALWRVLGIDNCWRETGTWWTSRAVRAARGEDAFPADADAASGDGSDDLWEGPDDLFDEMVIWRVEAANGLPGSRGVYEIVHAPARGCWRMRGVID